VPTPAGDSVQAQAIAADVVERMQPDWAYLLGPGTTTRAVTIRLGLPKTLVGVDIITRNRVLLMDVGERQILDMLEKRPLGMIVTPIGGQGFLFGRGSQPLSPEVIRRVGRDDILVISPTSKIAALRGQPLRVDSGDLEVDQLLSGYIEVITGHREKIIYRVSV
ncbi:MAG: ATP-NAD kinase, partial [Lentisphaerota bacterium]